MNKSKYDANNRYLKEHYEHINLAVPKGTKEEWKKTAEYYGLSLCQLVRLAVSHYKPISEGQHMHYAPVPSASAPAPLDAPALTVAELPPVPVGDLSPLLAFYDWIPLEVVGGLASIGIYTLDDFKAHYWDSDPDPCDYVEEFMDDDSVDRLEELAHVFDD